MPEDAFDVAVRGAAVADVTAFTVFTGYGSAFGTGVAGFATVPTASAEAPSVGRSGGRIADQNVRPPVIGIKDGHVIVNVILDRTTLLAVGIVVRVHVVGLVLSVLQSAKMVVFVDVQIVLLFVVMAFFVDLQDTVPCAAQIHQAEPLVI